MTFGRPSVAAVAAFEGWRALRHRNYRLFFGGQFVSLIGTWMQQLAQGWLVLQLTNDPLALGVVAAAQFLPVLVLGLFGGLLADALPKRRTLIATQIVAMVLAFTLFGLSISGVVEVWHVVALALLLGCANAVDMPTRQAFAVEMVGREDIGNAIALNSAVFNMARIVGPAIGGLTIGAFGIPAAFLLNGISFLAVIGAYLVMRDRELQLPPSLPRPGSAGAVVENLVEGLGYVRRTGVVLMAIVMIAVVSTFAMNFTVLMPPLARDVLGLDATGFGFLMSAMGLGSLTAALGIAFAGRTGPRVIVAGAFALGLFEVILGLSRSFPLSMVAIFLAGFGAIAMSATANTVIQLSVPDHLRGRVISVYTTVFAGSTPIGGLVMGAIASAFGTAVAIGAGGVVSIAAAVGATLWLRTGLDGGVQVQDREAGSKARRAPAVALTQGRPR
ncbi:MAG: MFS transporter [Chloroflexi bacterium]|nr:MFS transporter [Chloroflexota bacterium]